MSNKALRLFKVPFKKDEPLPAPIDKQIDKFAVKKFRKLNPKKIFHIDKKVVEEDLVVVARLVARLVAVAVAVAVVRNIN